jgi:hypothetical protein
MELLLNEGQSFFTFDRLVMDYVYRELCASQDERKMFNVCYFLLWVFSFEHGFLALCMNGHIVMLIVINQKLNVASIIQIYIIFLCDVRLWVSVF